MRFSVAAGAVQLLDTLDEIDFVAVGKVCSDSEVDAKCNPSVLHVLDLDPHYTVKVSGDDVSSGFEDQGAFFA